MIYSRWRLGKSVVWLAIAFVIRSLFMADIQIKRNGNANIGELV